jgi:hypothetical protein
MFLYSELVINNLKLQFNKKELLRLCKEYMLPVGLKNLYVISLLRYS